MNRRFPMRKPSILFILPLMLASLVGCNKEDFKPIPIASSENQALKMDGSNYLLDFYALNDLHGAVVENVETTNLNDREPGMARIGAFIREKRNNNLGGSFFLSNGDAYQGSADSNITYGKLVMEMFNLLDFESNSVGNHEFDWTIPTLLESMEEAKVEYSFLACNIKDKAASEIAGKTVYADWCDPYKIEERGVGADKVKIGIIGSIATGLESSILSSAVRNYEFLEPLPLVQHYSQELKDKGCDVIIYTTHGGVSGKGGTVNHDIANYVDVIFTGHTHTEVLTYYPSIRGAQVPVLQGRSNGILMSHAELRVDKVTKVVSATGNLLSFSDLNAFGKDKSIEAIYDKWNRETISAVKNEKIGSVSKEISKDEMSTFLAKEMLSYARGQDNAVVAAFHNGLGGVRDVLRKGNVTYGDIYKIFPFDNALYFVTVPGTTIAGGRLGYFSSAKGATIDGLTITPSGSYRIALISYLAEHDNVLLDGSEPGRLVSGTTVEILNAYPRDIVANAFRSHQHGKPLG